MANELRPLSLGEILDRSFTLYRRHFWLFIGIMALPHIVNVAVVLLLQGLVGPIFALPPGLDPAKAGMDADLAAGKYLLVILVAAVVGWVLYSLAMGATTFAVSEVYLGRPSTIRGAYQRIRGRLGALMYAVLQVMLRFIGLLVLVSIFSAFLIGVSGAMLGRSNPVLFGVLGLLVMLLMFAGFVLAFWIVLRYGVVVPALLLENLKARQALKRSAWLTKGYRGRIFLTFLLMSLLAYVVILVLQGPFWIVTALTAAKSGHVPAWLGTLSVAAAGLGGALSGPLLMIGFAVLYYDIRVRREAFDLQLMMAALEPAAPPSSPGPSAPPAVTGA